MTLDDAFPHLTALAMAQAEADQPGATLRALDLALAAVVGHRLCTIQVHYGEGQDAERVYSNLPDYYPVGERKKPSNAPRMQELLTHGRPILVRSESELRASYADHAGASSLNCGSAVNTPVRWQGRTLGQVNLMHQEGWYDEHHLPVIRTLAQFLAPVFLDLIARR